MTQQPNQAAPKKPYERPQISRVRLETLEATLGTGCQNPGVSLAEGVNCQSVLTPCDVN